MFSLELGDEVADKTCQCSGEQYKSVVGFIKQDNDAYAVYFATLQTGHPDITVGLTLSIGKWWDDTALDERHWIYLTVKPSPENFNMRIEEPDCSPHLKFQVLRNRAHSRGGIGEQHERRLFCGCRLHRG